jgi:hypothetical protein
MAAPMTGTAAQAAIGQHTALARNGQILWIAGPA